MANGHDKDKYLPEKFPLQKGMKGTLIEDLQKELNIPHDKIFGELTELEVIKLGYAVPLTEEDYKKIVKSEYKKIYEWIVENITKSRDTYHLDGCVKLVDFFLHRKYKKIKPAPDELATLSESLYKSIDTKRNTMYTQRNRDKKNNS